jgi:hypothetical protein
MPTLSANQKLVAMLAATLCACLAFLWIAEHHRMRKGARVVDSLTPDSITSITYEGKTITEPQQIANVLGTLQQSEWHALERRYARDHKRMILRTRTHLYVVDVRPLGNGTDIVQFVAFNPSNQGETVLVAGENSTLEPTLQSTFSH